MALNATQISVTDKNGFLVDSLTPMVFELVDSLDERRHANVIILSASDNIGDDYLLV